MKVVVETPKYSFVKYKTVGGRIVKDFTSPLPNLFTYGYVENTMAQDGAEEDAVILDGSYKSGDVVGVKQVGVVEVVDDGVKDDKKITSTTGKITGWDRIKLELFFMVYIPYKRIRYLVKGARVADCRYLGFKLKS